MTGALTLIDDDLQKQLLEIIDTAKTLVIRQQKLQRIQAKKRNLSVS
ncbi:MULTISPECIES: hypothetical protein [unclassified Chamaesiphon]|nr:MULTISPECIES: hypothetical protein [unclassified Chamaesiphon]